MEPRFQRARRVPSRLDVSGAPRAGHILPSRCLMRPVAILMLSVVFALPCRLVAQAHRSHEHAAAPDDSGFRAMQARGKGVMGVDQYTSVHRFDALPDGGRIELQRDRDDSAGATTIRDHLRAIAQAFATGEFTAPSAVHEENVPGVPVMSARRSAIRYEVS